MSKIQLNTILSIRFWPLSFDFKTKVLTTAAAAAILPVMSCYCMIENKIVSRNYFISV